MQTQAKYDKAMSAAAQATEKPKEAVDSLGEQIKSTLKSAASKGGKSVKKRPRKSLFQHEAKTPQNPLRMWGIKSAALGEASRARLNRLY